jgi:5'-methylthioadenosine phosphorylase
MMAKAEIGVLGGSGLYEMAGFTGVERVTLHTPFGASSDEYAVGELEGRRVAFLPRHGRGHRLTPTEVPSRANIFGFKLLGVDWIISVSAVGSLKEEYAPRHIVIPDQFFDRTKFRKDTFFGDGLAAHVSFAEPISPVLSAVLYACAKRVGATVHKGGTYVNMEGPAFSTKAESNWHRACGFDVIGMTNLTEAKLAREAEIAYATMAMVTDYDCWHAEEEAVNVEMLVATLHANADTARAIIREAVKHVPHEPDPLCANALATAIITDRGKVPPETVDKLRPIVGKYFET